MLQIKMEAEKDKGKLREEMVEELRSDKVRLQQQVAHLEELLRLQTMKELMRDGKEIKIYRERRMTTEEELKCMI